MINPKKGQISTLKGIYTRLLRVAPKDCTWDSYNTIKQGPYLWL